ncbi:hypothetical protein LY78DRAFT_480612 [Colletotrichum sublineola]|nr:hypothetical protein LY78DRAFT_480612 [Colletotrichum sublineola]
MNQRAMCHDVPVSALGLVPSLSLSLFGHCIIVYPPLCRKMTCMHLVVTLACLFVCFPCARWVPCPAVMRRGSLQLAACVRTVGKRPRPASSQRVFAIHRQSRPMMKAGCLKDCPVADAPRLVMMSKPLDERR